MLSNIVVVSYLSHNLPQFATQIPLNARKYPNDIIDVDKSTLWISVYRHWRCRFIDSSLTAKGQGSNELTNSSIHYRYVHTFIINISHTSSINIRSIELSILLLKVQCYILCIMRNHSQKLSPMLLLSILSSFLTHFQ